MKLTQSKNQHAKWAYKQSIISVLAIIVIGFILQLFLGKFNFSLLSHPVNLIIGICIIVFLAIFSLAKKTSFYQWFTGVPFSVTIIAGLLVLGLIMGLLPQWTHVEPNYNLFTHLGFRQVTSSWAFVLLYFFTLLSLGALIAQKLSCFKKQDYPFHLTHIGLWIMLFAAGLGYSDVKRTVAYVRIGGVSWRSFDENKHIVNLPFVIQLNSFKIEQYAPEIAIIDNKTGIAEPQANPQMMQLGEKTSSFAVSKSWQVNVEKYLPSALPYYDGFYQELDSKAANPAAKVSVKNLTSGKTFSGWVSAGDNIQSYRLLQLGDGHSVFMLPPKPKCFKSDVEILLNNGKKIHKILEVNKPLRIGSWTLYQYGYDTKAGKMTTFSSFQLVYDPWIYPLYIGVFLLALGSLCLICLGNKKRRKNGVG